MFWFGVLLSWPPPVVRDCRVGDLNDIWRGYLCERATQAIDEPED